MTTEKFTLNKDLINVVSLLPKDKAGELFLTILEHANGKTEYTAKPDLVIAVAFEPIKRALDLELNPEPVAEIVTVKKRTRTVKPEVSYEDEGSIYPFNAFWNDYGKKGNRKQAALKYATIKEPERASIKIHVIKYVAATPEIKFRKDAERYLGNECWNDEIVARSTTANGTAPPENSFDKNHYVPEELKEKTEIRDETRKGE